MSATRVCDYVDYIRNTLLSDDDIYKGENSDEDLSSLSDDQIWNHLKDKIVDSTITIVLISPNMKEPGKWERSQWIPWEIRYSLTEITRNDRTSHNNALLAVVLPNQFGSYEYYDKSKLFSIIRNNIDNGYIPVVNWRMFKQAPQSCINVAFANRDKTPAYRINKSI